MKIIDENSSSPTQDTDTFTFFVPVEIRKSVDSEDGLKKDTRRIIQGVASTEDQDLQGEKVIQAGLDYSYFLEHGYINDDHKPGPEHKVGEPLEARITKAGLWVKAFLYKGQERADHWWSLLQALEQSNANRKVGFSIEGKIVRRQGKSILKAWLKDVAITASPVNTHTFADIVKALSTERWCVHPWRTIEKSCKGCPGNCSPLPDASSSKEEEEKALSTGSMGGRLIPQSLEGTTKLQTYKNIERMDFDEAVEHVRLLKGYSRSTAQAVVDSIFISHGMR